MAAQSTTKISVSDVLESMIADYLHCACSSALLSRLLGGIEQFENQPNLPAVDRDFLRDFSLELIEFRAKWRQTEQLHQLEREKASEKDYHHAGRI